MAENLGDNMTAVQQVSGIHICCPEYHLLSRSNSSVMISFALQCKTVTVELSNYKQHWEVWSRSQSWWMIKMIDICRPYLRMILLASKLHASSLRDRTSTTLPFTISWGDSIRILPSTEVPPPGSVTGADDSPIFIEQSTCDSIFEGGTTRGMERTGGLDVIFWSLDLVATSSGASSKKGIPSI